MEKSQGFEGAGRKWELSFFSFYFFAAKSLYFIYIFFIESENFQLFFLDSPRWSLRAFTVYWSSVRERHTSQAMDYCMILCDRNHAAVHPFLCVKLKVVHETFSSLYYNHPCLNLCPFSPDIFGLFLLFSAYRIPKSYKFRLVFLGI